MDTRNMALKPLAKSFVVENQYLLQAINSTSIVTGFFEVHSFDFLLGFFDKTSNLLAQFFLSFYVFNFKTFFFEFFKFCNHNGFAFSVLVS